MKLSLSQLFVIICAIKMNSFKRSLLNINAYSKLSTINFNSNIQQTRLFATNFYDVSENDLIEYLAKQNQPK